MATAFCPSLRLWSWTPEYVTLIVALPSVRLKSSVPSSAKCNDPSATVSKIRISLPMYSSFPATSETAKYGLIKDEKASYAKIALRATSAKTMMCTALIFIAPFYFLPSNSAILSLSADSRLLSHTNSTKSVVQ